MTLNELHRILERDDSRSLPMLRYKLGPSYTVIQDVPPDGTPLAGNEKYAEGVTGGT